MLDSKFQKAVQVFDTGAQSYSRNFAPLDGNLLDDNVIGGGIKVKASEPHVFEQKGQIRRWESWTSQDIFTIFSYWTSFQHSNLLFYTCN